MSNISPLRVWAVTPSGSYVLPDVGLVIRTTEGNWRAYTIENLGELSLGPFETLEQAKAALETIGRKAGLG
jgi:hypothetical protein